MCLRSIDSYLQINQQITFNSTNNGFTLVLIVSIFSLHYLIFASNAQFNDFIVFYPISVPKHKYLLLSHFYTLANIYVYSNVYFKVIYIYIGKYMLIA